jgi:hypothetical protein
MDAPSRDAHIRMTGAWRCPMSTVARTSPLGSWRIGAAALLLMLLGCLQPPLSHAAAVADAPRPGTARIWVYRDYQPYESLTTAYVRLNGAIIGITQGGGGSFYRDVAPGRYLVTVDCDGVDVNQFATIDVVPGETVYVKVESLKSWSSGGGGGNMGGGSGYARDTFYTRVIPDQLAQEEIANMPFYGGS